MTPKELMYVEDILAYEKQMQTVCADFATQLQDKDLKAFVSNLSNKHIDCFAKFHSLLNS